MNDESTKTYSENTMKPEETANTKPKKTKYVLIFLVVGLMIFSCIVIGLSFLPQNLTPNIQIEKEGGWLRVISVDREVKWNDMNITISAGNYSYIQFCPAPLMSMTYSYENGKTCPDNWQSIKPGNGIHFLLFNEHITVQLKWIPTNNIIGEWNFP